MSITIHHGANGSYKTSGVVQDYFIPAALDGRIVVTNIRGISRDRTLDVLPEVPDSFDVIYVDTDTREGRSMLAIWWHWVPHGALLLFDEAGVMFPKRWRQSDLDQLSYPARDELSGLDAAAQDDRPFDWVQAWEMHRHWNWDIVLSAPNIKSLRDDIRQTTEGAYKHKNKALLGPIFKGYKEGYHDAQKNGQSASDFDVIRDKRISDRTFKLYDSTKTGKASDTLNGFNLFKSPRLVFALACSIFAFIYAFGSGGYDILLNGSPTDLSGTSLVDKSVNQLHSQPSGMALKGGSSASSDYVGSNASHIKSDSDVKLKTFHPLVGQLARITGYAFQPSANRYFYQVESVDSDKNQSVYSSYDLENLGYKITPRSECLLEIQHENAIYLVSCIYQEII